MAIADLKELRRHLKPLGFSVTTKQYSEFTAARYKHLPTGDLLTYNVMSEDDYGRWKPLLEYLRDVHKDLQALGKQSGITGLALGHNTYTIFKKPQTYDEYL